MIHLGKISVGASFVVLAWSLIPGLIMIGFGYLVMINPPDEPGGGLMIFGGLAIMGLGVAVIAGSASLAAVALSLAAFGILVGLLEGQNKGQNEATITGQQTNNQSPNNEDVTTPSNNSGMEEKIFPEGVSGWSWGGFGLGLVWAIGNRIWIGLLALIPCLLLPYLGLMVHIYLGIKGRELAWKNKKWESVEEFDRIQNLWGKWGVIFGILWLGMLLAISLYFDAASDTRIFNIFELF